MQILRLAWLLRQQHQNTSPLAARPEIAGNRVQLSDCEWAIAQRDRNAKVASARLLLSEFSDNSIAVLFPLYFRDVADHVPQAVQFPTLFPTLFLCGKTPTESAVAQAINCITRFLPCLLT